MAFLSPQALAEMGFASVGKGVLLSDRASVYGAERISLGDHTRIDDFCILSAGAGGFSIGRYVHLACYSSFIGAGALVFEDFVGVSARTSVYTSNDDYSGEWMTNPTVPAEFTNVTHAPVTLRKHALVGSGAIILPGVELAEGAVVGALSLVTRDCEPWTIYSGVPARKIKERSRRILSLEDEFIRRDGAM